MANAESFRVQVGPCLGYVFIADRADQLCFVPAEFVSFDIHGEATVDHAAYAAAGWSQRNARWALTPDDSGHVFPDDHLPLADGTAPSFQSQLERWRQFAVR